MKKRFNIFIVQSSVEKKRKRLEEKAVHGAKRAVQEHRAVFDKLAEYDQA